MDFHIYFSPQQIIPSNLVLLPEKRLPSSSSSHMNPEKNPKLKMNPETYIHFSIFAPLEIYTKLPFFSFSRTLSHFSFFFLHQIVRDREGLSEEKTC